MLLLQMFWWIPSLQSTRRWLDWLLLLLPPYALAGGLLRLAENQIHADLFTQFGQEGQAG